MTLYHLIGRDWSVADGYTFLASGQTPLRSHTKAVTAALGLHEDAKLFLFQCDEQDFSPLTHLDLDKTLDEQGVPPQGYIYVGVTTEEDTTPKARRYASNPPRRNSPAPPASQPPSQTALHAGPTTSRTAHTAPPRTHAMITPSEATATEALESTGTHTATAPPIKKLRFADEATAVADASGQGEPGPSEAPTGVARSAMKPSSSTVASSNASEAARSPRVRVDPSPPVVIEADPAVATAPGSPQAIGYAHHHHQHDNCAVASVLADIGCEGVAPDTQTAARNLLLRLAETLVHRKPRDVETCLVDFLCSEQLHTATVSTNLVASSPSRAAGLAETPETTHRTSASVRDDEREGAKANGVPGSSRSSDAPMPAGSPPKELSTAPSTTLMFAPVGNTVAERLAFGTSAGLGRTLVMRLAKLILDVKPDDPEEFLWTRLTSRNFGEEVAMNTFLARTVDPDVLMAAEDPTIAALLREIPAESPGFNVIANVLPSLFAHKPENPVNYMFDHFCGRTRSSYAASMRSSMRLAGDAALDSRVDGYTPTDEPYDDDDDDDLDGVEVVSEPAAAAAPYLLEDARRRCSSTSSNVNHFLHALHKRTAVDTMLSSARADLSDASPGSPVSLRVHPSASLSGQAQNPRRVSIAGEARGEWSCPASNRHARTASSRSGQDHSPLSTPTAGRRGETEPYPLSDRVSSRRSNAGGVSGGDGQYRSHTTRQRASAAAVGGSVGGGSVRRVNRAESQLPTSDLAPALAAAALLGPAQLEEARNEYAQLLAVLELRIRRMEIELACRCRTREYQEKMMTLFAEDDENGTVGGPASADGEQRSSASLKRAYAAERETARFIDALQEQQNTLMVLVGAMRRSATTEPSQPPPSSSQLPPAPRRGDSSLPPSGGSWAQFSSAPLDDVPPRRP